MKESKEQSRFRVGRSCMDNIFCLKQVVEKEMAVRNPTDILFIDLIKAYDNVLITELLKILKEMNLNPTHFETPITQHADNSTIPVI